LSHDCLEIPREVRLIGVAEILREMREIQFLCVREP
jgi:hypothetical protein